MKLPILSLLLAACLAGCGLGQPALTFLYPGEREGEERQRLISDEAGTYLLRRPVLVSKRDQALYLRYRGGPSVSTLIVLGEQDRRIAAKTLPAGVEATVYLALPRGQAVRGFRIDAPAAPGSAGTSSEASDAATPARPDAAVLAPGGFELLEAGIADAVSGLRNEEGQLLLGTAVEGLDQNVSSERGPIEARFSASDVWPLRHADGSAAAEGPDGAATEPGRAAAGPRGASAGTGQPEWQLEILLQTKPAGGHSDPASVSGREGRPEAAGTVGQDSGAEPAAEAQAQRVSVQLSVSSGGKAASFRHTALAGGHRVFLYSGMLPSEPAVLRIEPEDGASAKLERLEIARLPRGEAAGTTGTAEAGGAAAGFGAVPRPLPADPGAVLLYDEQAWRQPQYELFSWARFPKVLIMDTASYQAQSRFFKRLAFFVEKRGHRGRLVPNEEFAGLHGFNAHDYRAEDLARFFQAAREEGFVLNPEEQLLERILLAAGVIRDQDGFIPGQGAILSISRGSDPLLRRHLLTHECYHGVFFSLPEYRQACFEAWERLSEPETDFWKLFFRWVGYDTGDAYLTVNEYQAYLFQQHRSGARYYFNTLTASRLKASYPGQAAWLRRFLDSDPDSFVRSYDLLEPELVRTAGMEGGGVIELEAAETK